MEVWIRYDGKVLEQIICEDEPRWSTEGGEIFQVDRLGDLAAELFDPITKSWIPNPTHAAFLIDFDLGVEHKAKAHAQKIMEARLFVAGIEIDGLLKKESEIAGIQLSELVDTVIAHNEEFEATELTRREIKMSTKEK